MESRASSVDTTLDTQLTPDLSQDGDATMTRPPVAQQRTWVAADYGMVLAVAAFLAAVAFIGDGGLRLGPTTLAEVIVDAVATVTIVAAVLLVGFGSRINGGAALAAVTALAGLTALSITWSLYPSDSWLEANRTLSYVAAFAGGIAAVRLAWSRWTAMVVGVLAAMTVVSLYGLATKIVPGLLAPDEIFTRLREPYGYWNAVGITAAMGMPLALWLGTRDEWNERLTAIGCPVFAALVVTLMMSYSRASIIAAVVALGLWFVIVPLRLRSLAVLVPSTIGGALVTAWAFSQSALSDDRVSLTRREDAGLILGLVLVLVLVAVYAVAIYVSRRARQASLSGEARRKVGGAALTALAIALVAGVAVVGLTGGGFSGRWHDLTHEPGTPTNDANRLTQAGNVRTIYWGRALDVFNRSRFKGFGAGSFDKAQLRFRHTSAQGRHAHGYVHQTLADLGLLGLGISLIALGAWLVAASSTLGLRRGRWRTSWSAERSGTAALALVAVAFGVHSTLDWTWFVPAVAVTGLLTAGWVAGRGPIDVRGERALHAIALQQGSSPQMPERKTLARRAPVALGVLAVGVMAVLVTLQPWRADQQSEKALNLATEKDFGAARAAVERSKEINPLSPEPYFDLAAVEVADGNDLAALRALQVAVQREPANPEAWRRLGDFYLNRRDNPARAIPVLRGAIYLDPLSPATRGALLLALRAQQVKREQLAAQREAQRVLRRLRRQAKAGLLPAQQGVGTTP